MTCLRRTLVVAALAIGLSFTAVEPALAVPKAPAAAVTYKVQPGDSLMGIAFKLNVKVYEILTLNKLVISSVILPGQVLSVPAAAKSVAGDTTAAPPTDAAKPALVYEVVKNDYLTGIATKLNVPIYRLLASNHLVLNSLIWPGMQLVVPAGGSLPVAKVASSGPASTTTTTVAPPASPPYVIVKGDSLSGIANKLGVKLGSLLAVNQLSVTSFIYPDMKLVVPAGGALPTTTTTTTTTITTTTTTAPRAASSPNGTGSSATAPVPAKVNTVLDFIRAQLGKPYKAFMAGPDSYDCSGLTMAGYAQIGITLPHYSGAQIAFGTAIDWTTEPIRPGDLVFLETATGSGVIGHVGIATGATTWIHAPRTGDVVRTGTIPFSRVVGVRRLVNG